MDDYDDSELVRLAGAGDEAAFERLFEKYYLMVYRLAYKWCGQKQTAEDIAQETFVKVVRKLQTFGYKSTFKTWLYRIVINTAKDFGRRRDGRQSLETALVVEQLAHNPASEPEDTVAGAHIMAMLDKLPAKQKQAVLMVCGEGLSHKEAARILDCMETTISWRVFQARKKLKKILEQGK